MTLAIGATNDLPFEDSLAFKTWEEFILLVKDIELQTPVLTLDIPISSQ